MVKHTSFPFPRTSKNALESDKKKKSQNDGCADPAFKFQRERETLTFQWDGVCFDEHLSSLIRPLRLTSKALMHLKRKYKRATPRHSIVMISDTNSHPSTESIAGQIKDGFQKRKAKTLTRILWSFLLTFICFIYFCVVLMFCFDFDETNSLCSGQWHPHHLWTVRVASIASQVVYGDG